MTQYQETVRCDAVAYFPTHGSEGGWPSPSTSFWMVPGTWRDQDAAVQSC